MPVVREFLLPDLGEGLTEAEIVRWLVQVGDVVTVDQPVVEVETAKAVVEVPCPYGGVVTTRFGEPGEEIPVGNPLVTVAVGAPDGQAVPGRGTLSGPSRGPRRGRASRRGNGSGPRPAAPSDPATDPPSDPATVSGGVNGTDKGTGMGTGTEPDSVSGNVLVGYGTSATAARRRRVERSAAAARTRSVSRTPGAPPPAPPSPTADRSPASAPPGPVAVISPLVRRLAREHGLDLRALTGSGPEGLILRADVERAAAATAAPRSAPVRPAAGTSAGTAAGDPAGPVPAGTVRVPLKGVRRAVADKLSRSRREIPDATCWVDADATELLATRAAMNASAASVTGPATASPAASATVAPAGGGTGAARISLLAVLARITTAALARHPALNSTVDLEREEIVHLPSVHLGFAAQTGRGLVVPVIHDAHRLSTAGLSAEIARLTEAARTGTLTPADLTGGTFTLNNYGVFGVDGSTPIINHPEAAMLGVGRITPKPWVHRGALAVRQVVQLSFTFDHRVCDGGTAGGFLRLVADCVEQPAVLLRHL